MKLGFTMIDCQGLDLTSESTQTIPGLYARMSKAIDIQKPCFAYNIIWGESNPMTPIPVMLNKDSGNIVGTAATLQIVVTASNVVTIVNMVNP